MIELDNGPKNHILHQFLVNSLTHLDDCLNGLQTTEPDWGILDDLFRRLDILYAGHECDGLIGIPNHRAFDEQIQRLDPMSKKLKLFQKLKKILHPKMISMG